MIIYLICFISSLSILYFSNRIKDNVTRKVLVVVALIIPCLLASLRSLDIGTDLSVYVKPMHESAINSKSWNDFYNDSWIYNYQTKYVKNFEIGFSALIFIITRLTGNFQILLFIMQVLIIFPIYCAFKKIYQVKYNEWIVMLIFYFTFYNLSFNIVRQFIGISFAFLGLSYILERRNFNKFKVLLCMVLGFLFHKSTIISLFIYMVYLVINKCDKKYLKYNSIKVSLKTVLIVMVFIISIISILNITEILEFFEKINLIDYSGYIDQEAKFSLSATKVITVLPIFILVFMNYKNIKEQGNIQFYLTNYLLYFSSILLSTISEFASRIGYIFQLFNCVFFVMLCNTKKNSKVYYWFIILYVVMYWWFFYVYLGYNHTVPFTFYN